MFTKESTSAHTPQAENVTSFAQNATLKKDKVNNYQMHKKVTN